MRIGINALNIQTERDYWRLNNLIKSLGDSRSDGSFLLIAREEQKDFIAPAPDHFEYRFMETKSARRASEGPLMDRLLKDLVSDFRCDLLFGFGSSDLGTPNCPRVTLECDNTNGATSGKKNGSGYKLKLVARSLTKNQDRSEEIIFPSRFTSDFLPLSSAAYHQYDNSNIPGRLDNIVSEDGNLLSRYRITGRYFFCVVYPDSVREMKSLIKAYRKVSALNVDLPRLVLASAGRSPEDIAAIMDITRKLELDSKVIFIGALHENDLPELLEKTLSFIYPHQNDDSPEILLAAMACGAAILCSNKDDIPEIAGSAALYFDPADWDDFAFKLNLLSGDEDLVEFLGKKSRETASRFTWENTAGKLVGFFADVLRNRNASPAQKVINSKV